MSAERFVGSGVERAASARKVDPFMTARASLEVIHDVGYRTYLERMIAEKERVAQGAAERLAYLDTVEVEPIFSAKDRADLADLDRREGEIAHHLKDDEAASTETGSDAQRLHRLVQRSEQANRARTILLSLVEERKQIFLDAEEAAREPLRAEAKARLEEMVAAVRSIQREALAAVEKQRQFRQEIQEKRQAAHERIRGSVAMAVDFFAATQIERPSREELLKNPLPVYDDEVPLDRLKELAGQLPQPTDGVFTAEQCEQAKRLFNEIDQTYPLASIHAWDQGSIEAQPRFAGLFKRYEALTQERDALRREADRLSADLEKRGVTQEEIEHHPEGMALLKRLQDCDQSLRSLNDEAEADLAPLKERRSDLMHEVSYPLERVRAAIARTPVALAINEYAALRERCLRDDVVDLGKNALLGESVRARGEHRDRLFNGRYLGFDGTPSAKEVANELDSTLSPLLLQDLWREVGRGLRAEEVGPGRVTAQTELCGYYAHLELTEEQMETLGGERSSAAWFFKQNKRQDDYGDPRFAELAEGKTSLYFNPFHQIGMSLVNGAIGFDAVADPELANVLAGYQRVTEAGGSLAFYQQYADEMQYDAKKLNGIEAIAIELAHVKNAANVLERVRYAAPQMHDHDLQIVADLLREPSPASERILEEYLLSICYEGVPDAGQAKERVTRLKALDLPLEYGWNGYFSDSTGVEGVYVNAVLAFDTPTQQRWAAVMRDLTLTKTLREAVLWCRRLPNQGLDYLERVVSMQKEAKAAKDPALALEFFVECTRVVKDGLQVETTPDADSAETVKRISVVLEGLSPDAAKVIQNNQNLYRGSVDRLEEMAKILAGQEKEVLAFVDLSASYACRSLDDVRRLVAVLEGVRTAIPDQAQRRQVMGTVEDLSYRMGGDARLGRTPEDVATMARILTGVPAPVLSRVNTFNHLFTENLGAFEEVVTILRPLSPKTLMALSGADNYEGLWFAHLVKGTTEGLRQVASVLEEAIKVPIWNEIDRKLQQESLLALADLPRERWGSYLGLLRRLDQAPSQAIQRVKVELAREISATADPEAVYERVVDVFIRNNLPTVGKVFRVFEILHPDEILSKKLEQTNLSPTLRVSGPRERMTLIANDLFRIHLESGNEDLRQYLQVMAAGERLPTIQTEADLAALSPEERKNWEGFVKKLRTLIESSTYGDRVETQENARAEAGTRTGELLQDFLAWKQDLGMRPGQSIKERLEEMFLRPVGLGTVEEALAFMDASKQRADQRNRALVEASGGKIDLRAGDLLKGFDDQYFGSILQNGSVAKEFLGASSDSDATPLDTDLSNVLEKDLRKGIPSAIEASLAKDYGRVLMVFRRDEAWRATTSAMDRVSLQQAARTRQNAPIELFQTAQLGERHYGVRTGLAMTHVNMMIVRGEPIAAELLRNLKMEIVQNNAYIPLVDTNGKILFTPADFDAYRERFSAGTRRSGLPEFEYRPATEIQTDIASIRNEIRTAEPRMERMRLGLRQKIKGVLERLGVLRDDTPLDLTDTGSSGRMTGDPASTVDFDFRLRIDPVSFRRIQEIRAQIANELGGSSNPKPSSETTVRLIEVPSGSERIEVDLTFLPQTEVPAYESSRAVEDRLSSIERRSGKDAREEVAANIVYAKRFLKAAHAYKIVEEGGLGGIGVENWILSHHGSFTEAAQAFLAAATDQDGNIRSYDAFRKRYELLDAGVNAKTNEHRDFLDYLRPTTYSQMVEALRARPTETTPISEPPTETPPT